MRGLIARLAEKLFGAEAARATVAAAFYASLVWRPRRRLGIISGHAERQVLRRYVCRPDKIEKVVEKAWRSKETSKRMRRKAARERHRKFRLFSGCIYVFAQDKERITLVTVIRPGVK